jgi:hypothetical protein
MRERVLSEFIDAWNDGRRPDVKAYLERVDATQRDALADDIATFLTWAPEPDYDAAALGALEAEPIVAESMAAAGGQAGLWPSLIPRLRKRARLSVADLAGRLAETLALPSAATAKTATYLTQMEHGELDPNRVSRRLLTALGSVLGIDGRELEAAGGLRGWSMPAAPATAAPMFRAEDQAAGAVRADLEVLADALAAPGEEWDEVDELFRGGRSG